MPDTLLKLIPFQNKGIITKGKKENGTSNGSAEPEKKKEQYFHFILLFLDFPIFKQIDNMFFSLCLFGLKV